MCKDCGGCDIPSVAGPAADQPLTVDIKLAGGIFVKSIHVHRAGTLLPQHSHTYDHISAIVAGEVRVWRGETLDGDYSAPSLLNIQAGIKHTFLSLCDGVNILCIHSIADGENVSIHEEHSLT